MRRISTAGRALLVAAATAAATAAGLGVAAGTASAAPGPERFYDCAGPYSVVYSVTDSWPGGFIGSVVIANSSDVVPRWDLSWELPAGQHVNGMWKAGFAHDGQTLEVNGIHETMSIPAAGAVEFGFNASGPGSELPTELVFNGAVCR